MQEGEFCNLIQRIAENYMEIDSDIVVDLKRKDKGYRQMCRELRELEKKYDFLVKLSEGQGKLLLSAEEHEILKEYICKFFQKDSMERRHIYFRGHTDGYAYLKEIGVIQEKRE